jgi:hypothetical protein
MLYPQNLKAKSNDLLENLGKVLDLSAAQYQAVIDRYNAVAAHLAKDNSNLKQFKPDIKPQGSFLLGTMIKPIIADDTLDVDLVCRLSGKKDEWAQYHLKQAVGDQLKADKTYENMLDEEGNRCWTLLYSDDSKFHMDILPALVGQDHFILLEKSISDLSSQDIQTLAIRITDRRLPNHKSETKPGNWPKSNPFGYAAWFKEKSDTSLYKSLSLRESVDPLPEYQEEKEPLQRVVQILKRHRDIMFGGNEHKPISIIITTLAAKAYRKEVDIVDALLNILSTMDSFIDEKYVAKYGRKIKWIANPVNDEENFADKWPEESEKEDNFFAWLEKARSDFSVLRGGDFTQIYRILKATLGGKAVNEACKRIGAHSLVSDKYYPVNYNSNLLSVSHREQPSWPINQRHNVEVHGMYKNGKTVKTITPQTIVPKYSNIYFVASTDVPKPYDVFWQVVNTGEQAKEQHGLRGGIFPAQTRGKGGLNQKEYSSYSGIHWIECFIVKNGVCVARSSEFFVSIQ